MTSISWAVAALLIVVSVIGFIAGYWVGCDVESQRAIEREDRFLKDLGKLRTLGTCDRTKITVATQPTVERTTASPLASRLIS